jgi:hypothetical protein
MPTRNDCRSTVIQHPEKYRQLHHNPGNVKARNPHPTIATALRGDIFSACQSGPDMNPFEQYVKIFRCIDNSFFVFKYQLEMRRKRVKISIMFFI